MKKYRSRTNGCRKPENLSPLRRSTPAGKAQRREVLKSVKVDKKDLQPQEKGKVTQKQAEKQIGEDGSR